VANHILFFTFTNIPSLRKSCNYIHHFKKTFMGQKLNSRIILAILISASLIACNGKDKSEETVTSTESSAPSTETAATTTSTNDMDAAKVAPNIYKVLADSMGIRILEVNVPPGDSSAMHSHPDNAVYVTSGGTMTFTTKDGSKVVAELKSGGALIRPAETHSSKNTGKTTIKGILVEVNRSGAISSPDALDATKVASKHYKTVADTMGIRIVEASYKPGESSVMHAHPDLALYVVSPGKAEFTRKDGSKQVMDLTKGMTAIVPADTHSAKNIGNTTFKGILIEVYRR